jgi:CheY-like chemotaxis protein
LLPRFKPPPDGELGLKKILDWQPDLITLDIEMPKMTGIELLSALKEKLGDRHGEKLPNILMVSTLTKKGAQITFQALNLGAKDFLCKPDSNGVDAIGNFEKELIDKAKALLESTVLKPASIPRPTQPAPSAATAATQQRPPMASPSLPGLFSLPDAIRQTSAKPPRQLANRHYRLVYRRATGIVIYRQPVLTPVGMPALCWCSTCPPILQTSLPRTWAKTCPPQRSRS